MLLHPYEMMFLFLSDQIDFSVDRVFYMAGHLPVGVKSAQSGLLLHDDPSQMGSYGHFGGLRLPTRLGQEEDDDDGGRGGRLSLMVTLVIAMEICAAFISMCIVHDHLP